MKRRSIPNDIVSSSFVDVDPYSAEILRLSDEAVSRISMSMPWQYDTKDKVLDPDGFSIDSSSKQSGSSGTREFFQSEAWEKYHNNPQVNTSLRGTTGRLAGSGFELSSDVFEIQEELDLTYFDKRNRLYHFLPKYVIRNIMEGELFLCLTIHPDGFVEIDFIDPSSITSDDSALSDGVAYHPNKPSMPLFYNIKLNGISDHIMIPSIYIAHFPDLIKEMKAHSGYDVDKFKKAEVVGDKSQYSSINGFKKFIVCWDRGLMTERSTGHLRTTVKWLNFYENLKMFEIDHKKSAGSYVWIAQFEDIKSYKLWLSLSDEDKRKTGIAAKKTPGATLILPPGLTFKAVNPQLQSISDSDTDIMHMVTSGLNEPEDVTTGQSKGTYASVKASRGPMSDRISDESEYFRRFLIYDLFGAVFHLKSAIGKFPSMFKVKVAAGFKGKKPIYKTVSRKPEALMTVTFPTSQIIDFESTAKALLGVKHGNVNDSLGIPYADIASKLGFGNYAALRRKQAIEHEQYPDLVEYKDQEVVQEQVLEPNQNKKKKLVKRQV